MAVNGLEKGSVQSRQCKKYYKVIHLAFTSDSYRACHGCFTRSEAIPELSFLKCNWKILAYSGFNYGFPLVYHDLQGSLCVFELLLEIASSSLLQHKLFLLIA